MRDNNAADDAETTLRLRFGGNIATQLPGVLRSLGAGRICVLELRNVGLAHGDAAQLASALVDNGSLTSLELGGNPLGDDGVSVLARALAGARALATLGLDGTGLSDSGGFKIAALVASELPPLTVLKLQHNALSDRFAAELARVLRQAASAGAPRSVVPLQQLCLQRNSISNAGAAVLLEAAEEAPGRLMLDLRFNLVTRAPLLEWIGAACEGRQRAEVRLTASPVRKGGVAPRIASPASSIDSPALSPRSVRDSIGSGGCCSALGSASAGLTRLASRRSRLSLAAPGTASTAVAGLAASHRRIPSYADRRLTEGGEFFGGGAPSFGGMRRHGTYHEADAADDLWGEVRASVCSPSAACSPSDAPSARCSPLDTYSSGGPHRRATESSGVWRDFGSSRESFLSRAPGGPGTEHEQQWHRRQPHLSSPDASPTTFQSGARLGSGSVGVSSPAGREMARVRRAMDADGRLDATSEAPTDRTWRHRTESHPPGTRQYSDAGPASSGWCRQCCDSRSGAVSQAISGGLAQHAHSPVQRDSSLLTPRPSISGTASSGWCRQCCDSRSGTIPSDAQAISGGGGVSSGGARSPVQRDPSLLTPRQSISGSPSICGAPRPSISGGSSICGGASICGGSPAFAPSPARPTASETLLLRQQQLLHTQQAQIERLHEELAFQRDPTQQSEGLQQEVHRNPRTRSQQQSEGLAESETPELASQRSPTQQSERLQQEVQRNPQTRSQQQSEGLAELASQRTPTHKHPQPRRRLSLAPHEEPFAVEDDAPNYDGAAINVNGAAINGDGAAIFGDGAAINGDGAAINGDGAPKNVDGAAINGDGKAIFGNGAAINGDGAAINGDGAAINGDGAAIFGDGAAINGDGAAINGDGAAIFCDGAAIFGDDAAINGDGAAIFGNGAAINGEGAAINGDGAAIFCDGAAIFGDGAAIDGDGEAIFGDGAAITGDLLSEPQRAPTRLAENVENECETTERRARQVNQYIYIYVFSRNKLVSDTNTFFFNVENERETVERRARKTGIRKQHPRLFPSVENSSSAALGN